MTERNGADSVALAYDGWAPIYDLVFGPVFREGRRVATQAAERVGGRILEVGVGTGLSLAGYRRENTIFGMDISAPMLWKARTRVERQGLGHVGGLAVMDAERLAFADDSFDVIVAQYVVTAVPNPERALDEFLRVVRPGGEIIIATRVGAETGLRGTIERALMPVTSRLGWRTEFPWSRYADWIAGASGAQLLERRALPPLGHFSLVRITKDERAPKAAPSLANVTMAGTAASAGGGPVAQRMASSPEKES
ncbi:class I SAM-dependent methyltransferase [Pararoseomonas sp. SCSIO 73927]|uniref:class I SAM-dependent methyltransferase n=1 Tax=Pararoseomonas sp. SCSIO 73927 TaxID=3114537 RepID=UPI0030D2895A